MRITEYADCGLRAGITDYSKAGREFGTAQCTVPLFPAVAPPRLRARLRGNQTIDGQIECLIGSLIVVEEENEVGPKPDGTMKLWKLPEGTGKKLQRAKTIGIFLKTASIQGI